MGEQRELEMARECSAIACTFSRRGDRLVVVVWTDLNTKYNVRRMCSKVLVI